MKPGSYVPNSHHKAAHRICDLCFRESGGCCINYRADRKFPVYHSCSDGCDDILLTLAIHGQGYIQVGIIRELHAKAVAEAREAFWATVQSFGLPFTADDSRVDLIVRAVMASLMESMRQQSALTAPGDG